MITWMLLPELKKWPVSYIQNVVQVPFKVDKAHSGNSDTVSRMYAFSRELDEELKNTGVIVSVLHPAPLKAVNDLQMEDSFSPMSAMVPRRIAEVAVRKMLLGARLIVPGFWNFVTFYFNKHTSLWFKSPLKRVIPREEVLFPDQNQSLHYSVGSPQ